MRKVIVALQISLDGYTVGPKGEMDWIVVNEDTWKHDNESFNSIDTVLLGRVNFQIFEHYWPAVAVNPDSTPDDIQFARWIETVPKVVFSRTLDKVTYPNTRLVKDNIAEEVSGMKQQPGKDIVLVGGADIIATFIKLNLIDEYRLQVNPVVLGGGKPLFSEGIDTLKLKLLKTFTLQGGVVNLHYEPVSG